jgi:hypothetical protein
MLSPRSMLLAVMVVVATLAFHGPAHAANLLLDPSFESAALGQYTSGAIGDGWSVTSSGTNVQGVVIAGTAATGQTYFGATLPADPLTSGYPQVELRLPTSMGTQKQTRSAR